MRVRRREDPSIGLVVRRPVSPFGQGLRQLGQHRRALPRCLRLELSLMHLHYLLAKFETLLNEIAVTPLRLRISERHRTDAAATTTVTFITPGSILARIERIPSRDTVSGYLNRPAPWRTREIGLMPSLVKIVRAGSHG